MARSGDAPRRICRPRREYTVVRRLIIVASAVLCGWVFLAAGCGSSDATVATVTAETSRLYPVSVDGKWGYIDKTGTIKIQPQYEFAMPFSEGLATVRLNGKWGYIDAFGTTVIQPQFDDAHPFSDGLATVGNFSEDGPLFGYIDKTGAWVIQPQFDSAGSFSEGLAAVGVRTSGSESDPTSITDHSWGYIDKTGTVVIPMQYQTADAFYGGVARAENWARVEGPAGVELVSTAYIDKTGKVIWQGK